MTASDVAMVMKSLADDVVGIIRDLARDGDLPRDLVEAPLGADTTLGGLALDSLGKLTLLAALDERLAIYIPDDSIDDTTTIGALVTRVARTKGLVR